MDFEIELRKAKYIQKHTFMDFPMLFELRQFFGPNFLYFTYPF